MVNLLIVTGRALDRVPDCPVVHWITNTQFEVNPGRLEGIGYMHVVFMYPPSDELYDWVKTMQAGGRVVGVTRAY